MDSLLGKCDLDELRQRTSEKWASFSPEVLPAFIAESDYTVATPILDAVREVLDRKDLGYAGAKGLGEAFAGFAHDQWHWTVDQGRVHATADVMTGIATMLMAMTPPGSGIVVNTPVYPPFLFRTEQAERRLVPVPLRMECEPRSTGRSELDLEGLDAALSRPEVSSYLLCNPHNPLGRVWSEAELLEIAECCWRHRVHLFVDEIHAPLAYSPAGFHPILSVDHPIVERTVAFHSASKGWNIPGVKCGLLVAGSDALSATAADRWEALFPSHLGVAATVAAFSDPICREWLGAAVGQLKQNRVALSGLLSDHLPSVGWFEPEASFLVWLDCRASGLGDDPAAVFLERSQVALSSGLSFGEPGRGHARLNIGTSPELLAEIVRRLSKAL